MSIQFKPHPELADRHAFLSPSKPSWTNYDETALIDAFDNHMNAALGTRLHKLANDLISLGIRLENTGQTLNMYVNDCIGYRMQTERPLYYSPNAFGTADAISFGPDPEDPQGPWVLRIFDLKNGSIPAKLAQLEIYAALFCHEYKIRPGDITFDLRFYQNDDIEMFETDGRDIMYLMNHMADCDKIIEKRKGV